MKTLKSITIGFCLLIVGVVAKANVNSNIDRTATPYLALETYVDAVGHGKLDGLDKVIDPSAQFNILRGKEIISFNKSEMINAAKQTENYEQNCKIRTSVVSQNGDITIARVDMRYDGFVRSNYVTLSNTGKGWKITNVYSVFN